jgi:hypothetical protein
MLADFLDRLCSLTTLRHGAGKFTRPGLRMLTPPAIGAPLVLYGVADARQLITSPVVRMLKDAAGGVAYVETGNTVYLLRAEPMSAGCRGAGPRDASPTRIGRLADAQEARARARQRLVCMAQDGEATPSDQEDPSRRG